MEVSRTTVVLGDVHARMDKLEPLLERIGVLAAGVRQPGFRVIQLGDLVNLGYGVEELSFLERAWGWIDVHVIGNHELPAIYWNADAVRFRGWEERDRNAERFVAERAGQLRAAASVGPWLITHAGLSAFHWRSLRMEAQDAAAIAVRLDELFRAGNERAETHEVFEGVGAARRPGSTSNPGIFWADIAELEPDYAAGTFPLRQIVGHTPTGPPRLLGGGRLWCIDPLDVHDDWGGVAALVTSNDGASFELFWQE